MLGFISQGREEGIGSGRWGKGGEGEWGPLVAVYCRCVVLARWRSTRKHRGRPVLSLRYLSKTGRHHFLMWVGAGGRWRSRRGGQRQTSWRPSQHWRCGLVSSWWRKKRSDAWRPASPPCSPSSSLEDTKLKTCLSSGLPLSSPLNSSSTERHAVFGPAPASLSKQ